LLLNQTTEELLESQRKLSSKLKKRKFNQLVLYKVIDFKHESNAAAFNQIKSFYESALNETTEYLKKVTDFQNQKQKEKQKSEAKKLTVTCESL
jgi:hypothetical protein